MIRHRRGLALFRWSGPRYTHCLMVESCQYSKASQFRKTPTYCKCRSKQLGQQYRHELLRCSRAREHVDWPSFRRGMKKGQGQPGFGRETLDFRIAIHAGDTCKIAGPRASRLQAASFCWHRGALALCECVGQMRRGARSAVVWSLVTEKVFTLFSLLIAELAPPQVRLSTLERLSLVVASR